MTEVTVHQAWALFRQALYVGTEHYCLRYLMCNSAGRQDGCQKAHNHAMLCQLVVAAVHGCNPDLVRRYHESDYQAVHSRTQALTDNLDAVIGFPLETRPDYDALTPLFFDRFFELAMAAMKLKAPT